MLTLSLHRPPFVPRRLPNDGIAAAFASPVQARAKVRVLYDDELNSRLGGRVSGYKFGQHRHVGLVKIGVLALWVVVVFHGGSSVVPIGVSVSGFRGLDADRINPPSCGSPILGSAGGFRLKQAKAKPPNTDHSALALKAAFG